MPYTLSTAIIGAKELAEAFSKARPVVVKELSAAIMKTARIVENKAKSYSPIDKGGLRGSLTIEGPTVSSDNVEARVGTNLPYALYQEKGTGVYAGRGMITPKRAKLLVWKKGGKLIFAKTVRGTSGKFYMSKAHKESRPLLDQHMNDAVNTITKYLAKG